MESWFNRPTGKTPGDQIMMTFFGKLASTGIGFVIDIDVGYMQPYLKQQQITVRDWQLLGRIGNS